jgi:hypothetical protein
VDDLPLQIGQVHRIVVDDGERAHPCRRQIRQGRSTQPARTDDERVALKQARLSLDADFVEQDMARVAQQLIVVHGGAMKKAVQCTAS